MGRMRRSRSTMGVMGVGHMRCDCPVVGMSRMIRRGGVIVSSGGVIVLGACHMVRRGGVIVSRGKVVLGARHMVRHGGAIVGRGNG